MEKKARKEATKERVTRECHVKNVVFVTAPGVTAIPYLLVDNFSLGKREIEWAQVFFAGSRIRHHESLDGCMVLVVADPDDGLPGR